MTRVAMIATARPTFATDVASRRADAARRLLDELGAEVTGPTELVMTPEDVDTAAGYLRDDIDLVINVCASFSDASPALRLYAGYDRPLLLWAFREPGPVGDRLWLNSLCGANLFGHAVVRAGGSVRLVYGDPDEPAVREVLDAALAGRLPAAADLPTTQADRSTDDTARAGLRALRGQRIGIVGDAPPGFTPSEYDPQLLSRLLGLDIVPITTDEAFDKVRGVGSADRANELADARTQRPSLDDLPGPQVETFAAITSALLSWSAEGTLSALAVRCWPEFPTELGACPCSSLSRLADAGTPTACERDVYGTATMLLLEALGAGTTYLVDTVDLDVTHNVVRVWHCGSAATALAAEGTQATQSVHCNRRIGVVGDFPLRTGPVIMARLTEDPASGGLRMLIASGESVSEPNRFQGNTAAVVLDSDAETFVQGLVTGGFPHHTVLAWSDVRPQLRAAADLIDVPVVEW